jgi:hypothetical protein
MALPLLFATTIPVVSAAMAAAPIRERELLRTNDEPPKPWTVAQFELYRSHITNWVKNEIVPHIDTCRLIIVEAPVKSGKRGIAEYCAMRDEGTASPRVHAFISAWHRSADNEQREELGKHNMKVFSINNKKVAEDCIDWIKRMVESGKTIVLHLDECDHGTGDKQILGKVYKFARTLSQVHSILYSATPQEVLFSDEMNEGDDGDYNEMLDDILFAVHVKYTPPPTYCGSRRFLEEGLVHDAKPFFTLGSVPFTLGSVPSLTEQGLQIIEGLKASTLSGSGRNIAILRLTKKDGKRKSDKDIYKFLDNIAGLLERQHGVAIWVDKGSFSDLDPNHREYARKIEWSKRRFWRTIAKDVPILIVIDQTSSRSTEWFCHDRVYATHDYRTTISFATISQAQERVNHYENNPEYERRFQPILVYGHKKTFELSAGLITCAQYLECEWNMRKIDSRRARRENLGNDAYEIKDREGNLHPQHNLHYSKVAAETILMDLGCFNEASLSSRVRGNIRNLPVFDTHWFPCNSENFQQCITPVLNTVANGMLRGKRFDNPFTNAFRPATEEGGREKGYLRGWGVFEYESDVQTQPGCGVLLGSPRLTICYNQGVVGVAIRWHTGTYREQNRLSAYRSMYPERRENAL